MEPLLLLRPDDHLFVGISWSGFTVDGTDDAGIPVLAAGERARLTLVFPPQHVAEECSPPGSAAPVLLPAGTSGATVPGWRGMLSGQSRVVFAIPAGRRIPLTASGILDAVVGVPVVVSAGVPTANDTAVELPWRTLLVPGPQTASGTVVCRHSVEPVTSTGVSGMWRTRLMDAAAQSTSATADALLTVRADAATADTADPSFGPQAPNNTLGLPRSARTRLALETGVEPATATRLELSSLGGTLYAQGAWAGFEWEQQSVLGRDMKVRARFEGVMYPLGHRAEYLEIVTREFDRHPTASGAAVLRRIGVLTIVEPVRRAPADAALRRQFPLGDIEIRTTTFADIASPNGSVAGAAWQMTALPGIGMQATHFRPTRTDTTAVSFPIRCTTGSGVATFAVPLLFVADIALGPTSSSLTDPGLARRLAADYGAAQVRFAPTPINVADTRTRGRGDVHEVHGVTIGGIAQQADFTDGYRAALTQLEIALPALRVLRGDTGVSAVKFSEKYLQNGTEDVLLEMLPGQVRDIDFAGAADKSGGLVAPKFVANAISRSLGPVNLQAMPQPGTGTIDPAALFPSDRASLLGFPLKTLLTQLRLPPEITAIPSTGSAPEVRMQWRDVALRSTGPFVAQPSTRLDLTVSAGPNRNETVCSVKDFTLELPPGPKRVLRLTFANLKFAQVDGGAPDVDVDGVEAEFLGELKLLDKLQEAVDLGAAGKLLDVSPRGVAVRYSLPLPPVAAGAFVMRNIALTAGIDIPFNGDPVSVALGFASRVNPFQLSVMMFGGGGYVEIQLDRDGLRRLEAALEFGAFVAVDFVVASGEVHALGGVRFVLERDGAVTLTGYLRIGGCVEVLGLISVSIELCLSLTYQSERNALIGRATLVIEIDLTLWSDSVELDSGEWVLAGGQARPLAARDPAGALAQWVEYRAAFAGLSRGKRQRDGDGGQGSRSVIESEHVHLGLDVELPHSAERVAASRYGRWFAAAPNGLLNGLSGLSPQWGITVVDGMSGEIVWNKPEMSAADLAFAPDGRHLVVSTLRQDGTTGILCFDSASGEQLWEAPGGGFLCFGPDGTRLGVTGSSTQDGSWSHSFMLDAATGALLAEEGGATARPRFSMDSRLMCTACPSVVDAETGDRRWQVSEHRFVPSAATFTLEDDAVLCASTTSGTIATYELRNGADGLPPTRSVVDAPELTAADIWFDTIGFSPDRSKLVLLSVQDLALLSTADGRVLHRFPKTRQSYSVAAAFRPDSDQLAVNIPLSPAPPDTPNAGLSVIDTRTGSTVWSDPGLDVTDLALSGDGGRIAAVGADFLRVYELGTRARSRRDCGASISLSAVSAAAAGIAAVAGIAADAAQSWLTVFRVTTGEAMLERGHDGIVSAVAVSPDGHSVVTASSDGRCRLYDTLTAARWSARHDARVNAVAFSDDSRWVATASADRTARMFERTQGADSEEQVPLWSAAHPQSVTHIVFGPDSAWVATACVDRKIRILSAATGAELHAPIAHDARIRALAVNGNTLVSASDDARAMVIDAGTGEYRFRPLEHPGPVTTAALSRDGALLATAGTGNDVYLWEIGGAEAVRLPDVTTRAVVDDLAFTAGGDLVVATAHRVVAVIDPATGYETERLIHPKPVSHMVSGIDGAVFVTACADNVARVYEMGKE
ncbi:WD40 repeat domain-containing protein [Nocardia sp. GCM10030253]|uniref:WD40 repeat domain-containing protein n=1 Tax=Nocardia sp. GCM10030253 TaxID=3273404 RepID=UPI00362DDCE9